MCFGCFVCKLHLCVERRLLIWVGVVRVGVCICHRPPPQHVPPQPKLQAVFDEWAAHHRRVREAEDGAVPQRAASRPRPAASVALSADSVGQRAWAMAVAPLGCCDGPGHLEPNQGRDMLGWQIAAKARHKFLCLPPAGAG